MKYQISSGQGPVECELAVAKLLEYLKSNYTIKVLDMSKGYNPETYKSVRFETEDNLTEYIGTIKWICQSPHRPNHKRKNWFIKFEACDSSELSTFDEDFVVFETFRSGGNGGQHVNKVESGVRAIYTPTGLSVECTDERSQYANKRKAINRLREIIESNNKDIIAKEVNDIWKQHTQLIRGNSNIVFRGIEFKK